MKTEMLLLAKSLRIHALEILWDELSHENRLNIRHFLDEEAKERQRRRLNLYLRKASLKNLTPMTEFDWGWPKKLNRNLVEELFTLDFIKDCGNVVLVGPNGVGKTMLAMNLVEQAAQKGIHAKFVECSTLLSTLVKESTTVGLEKALQSFVKPKLLAIDEVGYLSFDSRHADLLFQLIHKRTQQSSTIITTNKSFGEWREVFPNAASLTALIDRLLERAEVVLIEGNSYRVKRFEERAKAKKLKREGKPQLPEKQVAEAGHRFEDKTVTLDELMTIF